MIFFVFSIQEAIHLREFNQEVEIKGFLHRDEQKQVILSEVPEMKSCCFSNMKIAQMQLLGTFPDILPKQISIVRGTLKENRTPYLENAQVIETHSFGIIKCFVILFALFLLYYSAKKIIRLRF